MMKKVFALLMALMMVLGMGAASAAETNAQQILKQNDAYGYYTYSEDSAGNAQAGSIVNTPVSYNSEKKHVEVSKTIAETETENVFDITLKVKTTQNIQQTEKNPAAAAVLVLDVSNSMDDDDIYSMAKGARSFLQSFAQNAKGGIRKVAVVSFGENAQLLHSWDDAADVYSAFPVTEDNPSSEQKKAMRTALGAHSGTNTEGGLAVAEALLKQTTYNGVAASSFDYKYVLLMTDGKPSANLPDNTTFAIKDTSSLSTPSSWQSWAGERNSQTYFNDAASAATNVKELAELYAIGYRLGATTTEGNWLKNTIATSTSHYFFADTGKLMTQFENIIDAIGYRANAWQVTDPIGQYLVFETSSIDGDAGASYDAETNTLNWNLRQATKNSNGEYVMTYTVKLDTLAQGIALDTTQEAFKSNQYYKTNGVTSLEYYLLDAKGSYIDDDEKLIEDFTNGKFLQTMYFNVPAVKGYKADLTFKKVDDAGKPISGVAFTLALNEPGKTWANQPANAVKSDANGVVTFTNIPSGHSYILTETVPDGYSAASKTVGFDVAYGEIANHNFTDANNELTVVNTRDKGSLTINKVLGKDSATVTLSDDITFTVKNSAGETVGTVTYAQIKAGNGTISNLTPGNYTVTESGADIAGYTLTTKVGADDVTATKVATVAVPIGANGAVEFENTYTRDQGSLTFTKKFAENSDITAANWPADKTIAFAIKDADGNTKNVTLPVKNEDGTYSWTTTVSGLATGKATVTETITAIDGYTAAKVEDVTVNVTTKETVAAEITNTYTRNKGSLIITKDFATASAINKNNWPAGKTITFTVTDADKGTHTVTLPVLNEDAETYSWTATINSIPTGEATVAETLPKIENYTLVEPVAKKVTVTEGDTPVAVAFANNTYTQDVGYIKVTKTFAGEAAAIPASIQVNVKNAAGGVVDTLTLSGETWVATSKALPVGSYSVEEVNAEVNGYILTATAAKDVKVTKDDPTPAEIVNKYTKNTTISKTATGLGEGATYPNPTIVLTKDSDKTEVALTANGEAAAEALVPGTYTLTENVAEVPYYTLSTTAEIDDGVNKITIKAGETFTVEAGKSYTVTVKNVYAREDSKYVDVKLDKVIALDDENEVQPEAATFIFKMTAVIDDSDVSTFALDNPTIEGGKVVAELLDGSSNLTLSGTDGKYTITATTNGTTGASGTIRVWANQDDLDKLVITITEQNGGDTNWYYDTTPHQFNGEAITITNTFKKLMPRLIIEKDVQGFADNPEDAPESISFTLTGEGVNKTVTLYAKDGWKTEIKDLEPGFYTVTENNADLPYYGVETYVDTMDNETNSKQNIELAYDETATVKFINVYSRTEANVLNIKVNKIVDDSNSDVKAPSEEKVFSFTGKLFRANANNAVMLTAENLVEPETAEIVVGSDTFVGGLDEGINFNFTITSNGSGTYTAPVTVKVNEEDLEGLMLTIAEVDDNDSPYWHYGAESKTLPLEDGIEFEFVNTYLENSYDGLRIPFSKTVVQTGTAEPGTNTFYFSYFAWNENGDVDVTVCNDPLNKYGKVEVVKNSGDMDVIAITVNGANTVNGYFKVSGKDSELPDYISVQEMNGLEFDLTEEELKAAGWAYDITTFPYDTVEVDGETFYRVHCWNAYLGKDESGERFVRISRSDDGDAAKDEMAFVNTYSADKELPPPPKTGDNSNVALWLALMSASALCFVIISKRRSA